MNIALFTQPLPATFLLFATAINPEEEPKKEKNAPVEPMSEKDEVKKAEEKTRDAQKEVDENKKEE